MEKTLKVCLKWYLEALTQLFTKGVFVIAQVQPWEAVSIQQEDYHVECGLDVILPGFRIASQWVRWGEDEVPGEGIEILALPVHHQATLRVRVLVVLAQAEID